MATAYDILVKARALIADKSKWYQNWYCNYAGTKFCALGAISKVMVGRANGEAGVALRPIQEKTVAGQYLNAAAIQLYGGTYSPGDVNDEYGHAPTMRMYDLAIKNAKRRHINGD